MPQEQSPKTNIVENSNTSKQPESFQALEEKLRSHFTNPKNIEKVIDEIRKDDYLHDLYIDAIRWLRGLRDNPSTTQAGILTVMITLALQKVEKENPAESDRGDTIKLLELYKKLGFE